MKKKIPKSVLIVGLICITLLEGFALYKGIDGTLLALVMTIIGGILGLSLPQLKIK